MQRKIIMTYRKNNLDKNKVILGLSGGVDSTAAALILLEKGFDVTGLYFDVCEKKDGSGREKAENAASQLGIGFIYKDVSESFENTVIDNFCNEYINGHTPNPCIVCNPGVKFKTLLEAANEENAYYIATGHYADTVYRNETDTWHIHTAANRKKDQSYMLYRLGQEAISRLILPLNTAEDKAQIRELLRNRSLTNAEEKDSQEICFIDDEDNYRDYISRRGFTAEEGNFVDKSGNILGRHSGMINYTIGQRKGLGIALGKPVFVTEIDGKNNQIVLGDNDDLFGCDVISNDNVLFGETECFDKFFSKKPEGIEVLAKIRYASKPAKAVIKPFGKNRIQTIFKEPQRAVTPGQSIVFYENDTVLGGGFIV